MAATMEAEAEAAGFEGVPKVGGDKINSPKVIVTAAKVMGLCWRLPYLSEGFEGVPEDGGD